MQDYLHAFIDNSSVVVASRSRVESLRAQPWLAGWYTTDCTSTFQSGSHPAANDELIIETSGTTGEPKLIRYRKQALRACAAAIAEKLPLTAERNAYVSLVSPRLAYGLSIIHSHLLAGVPVMMQPAPISLADWVKLRSGLQPNSSVYLVPYQSHMLAHDHSWRFDAPIELIFAGGRLTQQMADTLRVSFPEATIVNMYGQAEMGPRIAIGRSAIEDFEEGHVGQPLTGVKVQVSQQDPSSKHGGIEVDSPYRMSSYVGVDGSMQTTPSAWWPTGDVGYVSSAGDLYVVGRAAADINFLGTRVKLAHLCDAVRTVAGVLDVGASAAEHRVYGQRPSIRVLTESKAPTIEARVRKALSLLIGTSAAAVLIDVIGPADLPESGKL